MNTHQVSTSGLNFKTENRMLKYIMVKLGRMKNQLIMFAVFSVLSYPLLAIGIVSSESSSTFVVLSSLICCISIFGIVILTIGIVSSNYDYYSRRTVVDMNYSLPITNRERFWGDFSAGIAPVSIMHLLSIGIGILFLVLGKDMYSADRWFIPTVFQLAIAGFFCLLGIYVMMVFACILSARGFENWLTLMLLTILLPAVAALVIYMPFLDVPFVNPERYALDFTAVISPPMYVVKAIDYINQASSNMVDSEIIPVLRNSNTIPYLIFLVLVTALSYFLGTRRNVEKVGNAFAHKATSDVLLSALIFTIASLFCMYMRYEQSDNFSLAVTMVIITMITFLVFEVTTKRSFKRIHIGFIKYAGILGGSVMLSFLLFQSNGFGIGQSVPDPNNVKSVRFSSVPSYGVLEYMGDSTDIYLSEQTFTSPEAINKIIALNTESRDKYTKSSSNYSSTQVTYTFKNGTTMERIVFLSDGTRESLLDLLTDDEFKQMRLLDLRNKIFGDENDKETSHTVNSVYAADLLWENVVTLNDVDLNALFAAYEKDIAALTADDVTDSLQQPLFTLEFRIKIKGKLYNSSYEKNPSIYVLPQYENLLAVLANYISEDDYPKMNLAGKEIYLYWESYNGYPTNEVRLTDAENNPKYRELISKSVPKIFSTYSYGGFDCSINIGGIWFYVPKKHSDYAESIFTELIDE